MWKNNKFRGKKGKRKHYTSAEKASYFAGIKAGKRIARARKNRSRRGY